MENDIYKFIHTIFKIVETSNSEGFEIMIGDLYKQLDSIQNENQLNHIQQYIDIYYKDTQDDKKQILNLISQRIKQKLLNNNEDQSEFFNDLFYKNSKRVGISILQNDGSFMLTDKLTRKILEIKNASEIQKRLFDYCAIAGQTNLFKQFGDENILLQQNQVEKQFQMTIYSEKTRKKAMKHLNQIAKKTKENLLKMDLRNQRTIVLRQNNQLESLDKWEKVKIKYLKTITIKLTKVIMTINDDFLELIKNFKQLQGSQQLQSMTRNPTQQYKVVKCEISENPYVEEIHQDDIQKDSTLIIYEAKWKVKCEEIREEFKKIKRHKEQTRIENQFQSLYNISSELLQDLNSQIYNINGCETFPY